MLNLPVSSTADNKNWIAIADVHLNVNDSEKEDILLALIEHYEKTLGGIILLGDIFDVWFGYGHGIFFQSIRFLAKLKELTNRGVQVIYLEGNHDFLLKGFFSDYIKATTLKNAEFDLFGIRVYASHGDEFNFHNLSYYITRSLMSSRFLQFLVSLLPVDLLYWIFKKFSRLSGNFSRNKKLDKEKYLKNISKRMKSKNIDLILTGHNHTEMDLEINIKGSKLRLLNPGAFENRLFYVLINKDRCELKLYDILSLKSAGS